MAAPWERYSKPAQPNGPWSRYVVAQTPGAGPKAPTGFAAPGAARVAPIPGSEADIGYIASKASATARADQAARIDAERKIIAIQQGTPLAAANLSKAQSDAILAAQKVDEAKADQSLATMAANSNVHGEEYLKKYVPASMWNVVKAYARGDLGSRSGGMSTSMLPIIQHAMNYDPSTSGTNFPARVKMQSDLASGDPKSAGGSLQAFERMLLHGENVLDSGLALKNYHSGIAAPLNYFRNAGEALKQDPTLATFNEKVRNYAPEAQKAIAQVAGGEGEREGRQSAFTGHMSPEAITAGLQADAQQAFGAMQSVNDRYKRIMGKDIVDALSPDGKRAYNKIMSGGFDEAGHPLHPVEGFTPLPIGAPTAPPPPAAPPAAPTGAPNLPGQPGALATGPVRLTNDPKASALIDMLIRKGASADEINASLQPLGMKPVDANSVTAAQAYLKAHPDYKGSFGSAQRYEQNSLLTRAATSPVGVGMGAAADGALGGWSDEIGALRGGVPGTQGYSDQLKQLNDAKQAAFAQDPTASTIGNIVGSTGSAIGGGMALKGTSAALALGKYAPWAGASAYGALAGAGQDNGNRIGGAVTGAIAAPLAMGAGKLAAIPIGAVARTAPVRAAVNAARGMFGRSAVVPEAALSSAEGSLYGATNKAGPDNIRAFLGQASDLGVPASLADSAPEIRELGASAARHSPTASKVAEDAFIPRNRGQIDRLGAAVNRDLGPTANIPQLSEDLTTQAKTAAAPLYDQAYSNPGASSVKLDDLMSRPSMKAGLARAHGIALEEGRDPTSLGFDLNGQGEVTLNRVPSFHTLDYVKRGLDDTLEGHRNPITGKLDLNEATRAINATKNDLLGRVDKVNPDYAAARQAYAGPVQARDALARGQDAFSLSPDEVGMQVGNQSPEQLAQMQLGFRSQLMNRANNVRDVSNPFEATLGTPNARARIDALHPNNPGNANLFAQRDMEKQLADTSNRVLGNSFTAQRQIADKAFSGGDMGDLVSAGMDLAHGGIPVGTAANGLKKAGMFAFKKRATAKAVSNADELAPMVFNTDPNASASTIEDLIARATARNKFVQQMRPSTSLGYFGAGLGASAGQGF